MKNLMFKMLGNGDRHGAETAVSVLAVMAKKQRAAAKSPSNGRTAS
jgi:hypothetical protein